MQEIDAVLKKEIPEFLNKYERFLIANNNGWLVGNRVIFR